MSNLTFDEFMEKFDRDERGNTWTLHDLAKKAWDARQPEINVAERKRDEERIDAGLWTVRLHKDTCVKERNELRAAIARQSEQLAQLQMSEFIFQSLQRSVDDCNGFNEVVRLDEQAWNKLKRQALAALRPPEPVVPGLPPAAPEALLLFPIDEKEDAD